MPQDGYTTVTISDDLVDKLNRIMALHNRSSYTEAIEYATDKTLVHGDDITLH